MTSRRWAATILLLLAAVAMLWWSLREMQREGPARERKAVAKVDGEAFHSPLAEEPQLHAAPEAPSTSQLASPTSATPTVPTAPPSLLPSPAPGVGADIEQELDRVNLMLRDFRTIAGDNPVGTNADIVSALRGDNPKHATLLSEGAVLNAAGELVDRWETPYFFHQLSGRQMEIRSAGPDRQLWTDDDQTMMSGAAGIIPAPR